MSRRQAQCPVCGSPVVRSHRCRGRREQPTTMPPGLRQRISGQLHAPPAPQPVLAGLEAYQPGMPVPRLAPVCTVCQDGTRRVVAMGMCRRCFFVATTEAHPHTRGAS